MKKQNLEPTSNNPSNKNKILIVLLVVLFFVSSGVAGFSLYQNNQLKKQINQLESELSQSLQKSNQSSLPSESKKPNDSEPTSSPTLTEEPIKAAQTYLNAYMQKDWDTVERLCADENFNRDIAKSYKLTDYKILETERDKDPKYYHVYISLTNERGETLTTAVPNGPRLELLMIKTNEGWKALTWYFFS